MKKKLFLAVITLVLCSCGVKDISSTSQDSLSMSSDSNSIINTTMSELSTTSKESTTNATSEKASSNNVTSKESSVSSEKVSSSNVTSTKVSSEVSVSSSSLPSSSETQLDVTDITNWVNYPFSDGTYSSLNENWTYYYNTSINPNSVVRGDEYGVDLHKDKQRLVSPTFNTWEKVEVNIKLRFVPRSSSSYSTVSGKPQLFITPYDSKGNKLEQVDITLTKSNIPSDDKQYYTVKLDIYNNKMSKFDLNFGTSVQYSNSKWYTYAINEISLKGWPYGK